MKLGTECYLFVDEPNVLSSLLREFTRMEADVQVVIRTHELRSESMNLGNLGLDPAKIFGGQVLRVRQVLQVFGSFQGAFKDLDVCHE